VTRRVKAEPTKLNPLVGRVMSSSGAFGTARGMALRPFTTAKEAPRLPHGGLLGALALLALAAAVHMSGEPSPLGERVLAAPPPVAAPELFTLGVGDYREPAPKPATVDRALDSRTRFEVERLVRLTEAALRDQRAKASRAMNLPPNTAEQ
jgi:hypothetical protein